MIAILLKLLAFISTIWTVIFWISKTLWNWLKTVLTPALDFVLNNWLKVMIWGVFWWIALSLMGTLLAFVLYHLSATIILALSPFVTAFTIWLLVNFVLWIFFLFTWSFIFHLFRK